MVTLELQKKCCAPSDYRWALDEPIQALTAGKSDSESPFYQCKLGKHYIDPNAAIIKDPELESGVTNIQRGEMSQMTKEGKNVYKKLGMAECDSFAALSSGPVSSSLSMTDRLEKKN